jgi:hypothetical protein
VTALSDPAQQRLAAVLRGDSTAAIEAPLMAIAERQGVAPLLAERLQRAGAIGPDHALARAARQAAAADIVREAELRAAIDALAARQVPCLVFKGAQLAHAVYARPDLRPRLDTDLLVRDADRGAAHAALAAAGYEAVPQFTGELVAYQAPFVIRRLGRVAHVIDLHWRLANPQQFGAVLSTDELFSDAAPIATLGPAARGPGAIHALVISCVHPVAHHRDEQLLIWTHDVHLLAGRLTDDEWDRFAALAVERGIARVCAHSLQRAGEAFGTDIPGRVVSRLHVSPGAEATARYLAGPRRHVQTIWADLQTMSSWRDRWRLVQQHAFPPRTYMREVYAPASGQPLMILYARRMVRGARKWLART